MFLSSNVEIIMNDFVCDILSSWMYIIVNFGGGCFCVRPGRFDDNSPSYLKKI